MRQTKLATRQHLGAHKYSSSYRVVTNTVTVTISEVTTLRRFIYLFIDFIQSTMNCGSRAINISAVATNTVLTKNGIAMSSKHSATSAEHRCKKRFLRFLFLSRFYVFKRFFIFRTFSKIKNVENLLSMQAKSET